MKNGIYKTSDGKIKDLVQKEAKTIGKANVIQSNSNRGQNNKNREDSSKNRPQIVSKNNHKIETKEAKQKSSAGHLATFSSPEQLAKIKERQERVAHDNLLKKELKQFREELEQKYKKSEANKKYMFPRQIDSSDEKDSPIIDCIAIMLYFIVRVHAAYTSAVIEIVPKIETQQRSNKKSEEYFASTGQTITQKVKSASKGAQRESSENQKQDSNGKIHTKIQNLFIKKVEVKKTSRENSNSKDPELRVIKGTLIKTINFKVKPAESTEKRIKTEQDQITQNKNSSSDGKTVGTFESESNCEKQKITKNNANSCNHIKQKTIDIGKQISAAKNRLENNGTVTTRSSRKIEESPNIRNESATKNPEYFQVKKINPNSMIKSPAHKNLKSAFDMVKIVSAGKGKEIGLAQKNSSIQKTKAVLPLRQTSANK